MIVLADNEYIGRSFNCVFLIFIELELELEIEIHCQFMVGNFFFRFLGNYAISIEQQVRCAMYANGKLKFLIAQHTTVDRTTPQCRYKRKFYHQNHLITTLFSSFSFGKRKQQDMKIN